MVIGMGTIIVTVKRTGTVIRTGIFKRIGMVKKTETVKRTGTAIGTEKRQEWLLEWERYFEGERLL